jgi:hypothetical protein
MVKEKMSFMFEDKKGEKKMKMVFKWILIVIICASFIVVPLFFLGYLGNAFDATVGKQHMDIERNNFKHSKSFVEGKIQDLATYKREYMKAADENEKQQVLSFVNNEFANFDIDEVEDPGLRDFLLQARGE